MLDSYLKRDDVIDLIKLIKSNPKYSEKDYTDNVYSDMDKELALYAFYDALFKYKVIIDDDELIEEYIEQLEKIFKKIDNYNKVILGINNLICFMVSKYLKINDLKNSEEKRKIIEHVYDKYVLNGYYVHGFSTVYEKNVKEDGFVSEIYLNDYNEWNEIKDILNKYNFDDMLEKDFKDNRTYFTDDFIMGCNYSAYSPGYYSGLLLNKKIIGDLIKEDCYLKPDFNTCNNYLKRFMNNNLFSDTDKKTILDAVEKEWNLINGVDKRISLIVVKRSLIDGLITDIGEYLNDDVNVFDVIDRMLSPKNTNISFDGSLRSDDIDVLSLEGFYNNNEFDKTEEEKLPLKNVKLVNNKEFLDDYGNVYIFFIIGALLISLGVIITVIMVIRGM